MAWWRREPMLVVVLADAGRYALLVHNRTSRHMTRRMRGHALGRTPRTPIHTTHYCKDSWRGCNDRKPSLMFRSIPMLQTVLALPLGTNIYRLGEVDASNGFRRDIHVSGSSDVIQARWNRDDIAFYAASCHLTDAVLAVSDVVLLACTFFAVSIPISRPLFATRCGRFRRHASNSSAFPVSKVRYLMLGGIFDCHFFGRPQDVDATAKYGAISGHLFLSLARILDFDFICVDIMAGFIPTTTITSLFFPIHFTILWSSAVTVQWNGVDLYHDFTTDPVSFPPDGTANTFIPIVDAAIGLAMNDTNVEGFYTGPRTGMAIKIMQEQGGGAVLELSSVQLGDNYGKRRYIYLNILGVLQFQACQIPMHKTWKCRQGSVAMERTSTEDASRMKGKTSTDCERLDVTGYYECSYHVMFQGLEMIQYYILRMTTGPFEGYPGILTLQGGAALARHGLLGATL
ncbi:hypothetical protein EDD16DRAFT_1527665 [Pisolithus croceorrhizus]|nr:hypothetical protein EDD16DRAFT_1527665 [Pisolithus croceorrhizus]